MIDCIVTPTAGNDPHHYAGEMLAEPIKNNSNLGYYTNFMNLLDYAATAAPAGFQENGLPFGVTLFAPAHQDGGYSSLLHLASQSTTSHGQAPLVHWSNACPLILQPVRYRTLAAA